jgi:hypothetical protein
MKDKSKKDVKVLINNKKHVKLFDKDISTLYVLKSSVVSDTIEVKVKKEVKLCHQAIQIAQLMHVPSENFMSEDFVQKVFEEAWKYGSEVFAVKEAVIWGDNFKFPESVFNRDLEELRGYDMSLQTLCVERSLRIKHKELSVSRVMDSCTVLKSINEQQHMDIVSALDIAQHGVHIFTSEHFIPCAIPPPMRQIYITVASAVNKTIFEMYNNGQVLILPTNVVKTLPGVHFSPMHWIKKKDKASGRIIGDVTNDPFNNALNDTQGEVALQAVNTWGIIEHPTIMDFAIMILNMADTYGWDNIELWKMDLKGAFGLLRISEKDVQKLAFELTDGLSVIHLRCFFGWAATPFAFQVFTRLLQRLTNSSIKGKALLYVDDFCVCSPTLYALEDRNITRTITKQLMGEDSVAENKWEMGRIVDFVGWEFNLDTRTVTLSHKNHLKAVFYFFYIDVAVSQSLKTLQALASRATRYVTVCRHMKPYTAAFYAMTTTYSSMSSMRMLSKLAILDIQMWRAFLCLLVFDEKNFARPIDSFRVQSATFRIEYDASLTGLGFVISQKTGDSWSICCFLGLQFPFNVNKDSSFQNTCEFIAIVAAVFVLTIRGFQHFTYELIGDSMSSLKWSKSGFTKSIIARNAAVGMSLVSIKADANLCRTEHIAGKFNTVCDDLSRNLVVDSMLCLKHLEIIDREKDSIIQLLSLCDSTLELVQAPVNYLASKLLLDRVFLAPIG